MSGTVSTGSLASDASQVNASLRLSLRNHLTRQGQPALAAQVDTVLDTTPLSDTQARHTLRLLDLVRLGYDGTLNRAFHPVLWEAGVNDALGAYARTVIAEAPDWLAPLLLGASVGASTNGLRGVPIVYNVTVGALPPLLPPGQTQVVIAGAGDDATDGNNSRDLLAGFGGADTLQGGDGDDILIGGIGNDRLDAGDDNDRLSGGPGDDTLDGGPGRDIAWLDAALRSTVVTLDAGVMTAVHGGQTDTLRGVEELRFIDGGLSFDPASAAATVTRLHLAALGRVPTQLALNLWLDQYGPTSQIANLAAEFLAMPEFTARFGANLSNREFVAALYRQVLGREPEPAGLAFWTRGLDSSTENRPGVLTRIADSPENRAITAALHQGIWDRSEAARSVALLYDTALGRRPDAGGLGFWTAGIESRAATLDQVADLFVTSAEFGAAYGPLTNRAFAAVVHANTFGPGDARAEADITVALDAGRSRGATVLGLSQDFRHAIRLDASIGGETPDTYGIRLA